MTAREPATEKYYAHSTDDPSRANWQTLESHLKETAHLAAEFAEVFGAERAARLLGLLHDLGKYTRKFLARLDGSSERVDHSTAGAKIIKTLAGTPHDKLMADLLAYAIAGHHAGLPDKQNEDFSNLTERLRNFSETSLDPVWQQEIEPEATELVPAFVYTLGKDRGSFSLAFLGRMIFSCLVDADFKKTERFYADLEGREIDREWPKLQTLLPRLSNAFDSHMNGLSQSGGTTPERPIQALRRHILSHVRNHAPDAPGFFTLTVPTGGGKTLASLGFALDHAGCHRQFRRIIYAAPFTAIIDQTAEIFRKSLGEEPGSEIVLEHHSSIEEAPGKTDATLDADNGKANRNKLKLAMEDWAAPVIVTTNVQFFESLFAARPSRCRKLHNIANSIIILDEAQTLPLHLLAPATWALWELATHYGCTIVFCTATQPALDERHFKESKHFRDRPMGLPLAGRELAPEPEQLAERLTRVALRRAGAMDNAALVLALGSTPQGLVIVNSRRHALELYQAARAAELAGLIHLTTRQYAEHRRRILADIRERMNKKLPCRVIATSLVEAGVDLDFPQVWRAEAGLDQIVQAAGRCNREGRNPVEDSIVTVFAAPDYPPPSAIGKLAAAMERVAGRHGEDLLSLRAIEDFFRESYWREGRELDSRNIWDMFKVSGLETFFSYRAAAEAFRMIDNTMVPVIVAIDDKARRAVDKLGVKSIPSGTIARELQPYLVQIPQKARQLLIDAGHVAFVAPDMRNDQFAVLRYEKLYIPEIGLLWDDPGYLASEDTII